MRSAPTKYAKRGQSRARTCSKRVKKQKHFHHLFLSRARPRERLKGAMSAPFPKPNRKHALTLAVSQQYRGHLRDHGHPSAEGRVRLFRCPRRGKNRQRLLGREPAPGKTTTLKAIPSKPPSRRARRSHQRGRSEFRGRSRGALEPRQLVRLGVVQVMEGRQLAARASPNNRRGESSSRRPIRAAPVCQPGRGPKLSPRSGEGVRHVFFLPRN